MPHQRRLDVEPVGPTGPRPSGRQCPSHSALRAPSVWINGVGVVVWRTVGGQRAGKDRTIPDGALHHTPSTLNYHVEAVDGNFKRCSSGPWRGGTRHARLVERRSRSISNVRLSSRAEARCRAAAHRQHPLVIAMCRPSVCMERALPIALQSSSTKSPFADSPGKKVVRAALPSSRGRLLRRHGRAPTLPSIGGIKSEWVVACLPPQSVRESHALLSHRPASPYF